MVKIGIIGKGNTGKQLIEMLLQHQQDFTKEEIEQHYQVLIKESKPTGRNRFNKEWLENLEVNPHELD